MRAGLRYITTMPDLWIPLVMMAVIGTLAFNFQVVLPLFVTRTFGGAEGTFTLLFSVISIGALAGALSTARRTTVNLNQQVVAAGGFGVAMLALAAVPFLGLAFPVALAVGFFSIMFLTASTAIVQVRAEPGMRGRVLAIQAMVFLGSTPIGGPILGAVCDAFGARMGLVVGGVAAVGAAGWARVVGRRVSEQGEAVPPDTVEEALELDSRR